MAEELIGQNRWDRLWLSLGARESPTGSYERLLGLYQEPHRRYHNLSHIEAALRHLDSLKTLAARPELVEFALWMHDAIYDPRATDNEAKSADLAESYLATAGLKQHAPQIREMIMATAHTALTQADDIGLVVDIDLSVLALPPAGYERYTVAVRQEYSWVPEHLFTAGRMKMLSSLLDMPTLYSHPSINAKWGPSAIENMTRELRSLGCQADFSPG